MGDTIIKIEHVSKEYRLGAIGGTTLRDDLQRLSAKIRGKDDPTFQIGKKACSGHDKFLALDDVSFDVDVGEALGIIGHNGAGKSTLLKVLSRITAPTKGTISLNGRIASMLEVGTGFHPELTGRENVYMNGAILGMSKKEITRKFDEIVDFAEMEKFIDTPVKRYSSGMYVKLAFAVAAHLDSEIIVMDEVLAVGDMKFQQKCLKKMSDAAVKEGRTILYVSHNMNTIRQLCDRCIVLDHGKVVFNGNVDDATALYSGTDAEVKLKVSCESIKRESFVDGQVFIKTVEIINKETPLIYDDETLSLKIDYLSKTDFDNLLFRIIVFSDKDIPVGMASTTYPIKVKAGNNSNVFGINLASLAPGRYYVRIVFYEINSYGGEAIHDVVGQGVIFNKDYKDKVSNTTTRWKQQFWGNIELPSVSVD